MVELRNAENQVLKQQVWGTQYVDELCQTMIAPFPAAGRKPNYPFWVMQDANYNVLGVASRTGRLVERYEYTPYGQRTVCSHGWLPADFNGDGLVDIVDLDIQGANWGTGTELVHGDANGDGVVDILDLTTVGANWGSVAYENDPLVMYPRLEPYRHGLNPYGLCDFGHQGLMHDKEYGDAVYARGRYLLPRLGRWNGPDKLEYIDGMNRNEAYRSNPVNYVDPSGLEAYVPIDDPWVDRLGKKFPWTEEWVPYWDGAPWPFGGHQPRYKVIDYQYATRIKFSIGVAGKNIKGLDDSGTLLSWTQSGWWAWPLSRKSVVDDMKNDHGVWMGGGTPCRVPVRCKTNCGCPGQKPKYAAEWIPTVTYKNIFGISLTVNAHMYGTLEWSEAAGEPYCKLFESEKAWAKHLCGPNTKTACKDGKGLKDFKKLPDYKRK